jgi:hypothetical protein
MSIWSFSSPMAVQQGNLVVQALEPPPSRPAQA